MYVLAHTWRPVSINMEISTFAYLGNLNSKQFQEEAKFKMLLNFRKKTSSHAYHQKLILQIHLTNVR